MPIQIGAPDMAKLNSVFILGKYFIRHLCNSRFDQCLFEYAVAPKTQNSCGRRSRGGGNLKSARARLIGASEPIGCLTNKKPVRIGPKRRSPSVPRSKDLALECKACAESEGLKRAQAIRAYLGGLFEGDGHI